MIHGGTLEATALSQRLSDLGVRAVLSLAGRVSQPKEQALPVRVGGFGGVDGLQGYLGDHSITHVIDATHPFAGQMSRNAVAACSAANVPLVALTRAPWTQTQDDTWITVPDITGAVAALDQPAKRVFLAVGRMHLEAFAPNPQHHYLLRLVDPPTGALQLPNTTTVIDRGPFSFDDDLKLMRDHNIDLVVSKNSGGSGAGAKILAARQLGLPVIMIDRPVLPSRRETHSVDGVLDWLRGHGADLGV